MNYITNRNLTSIEHMTGKLLPAKKTEGSKNSLQTASFQQILSKQQDINASGELKFSKHANERLASRNIDLSKEQIARLESGADMAREKGIQESLVMVDDLAFIVNCKNNTVVTAVSDMEKAVFTNIDGAVIS
ncbi:TIGR02530 family flagellar biosynthesis protein [Anaeromicropila populeti]|uniref:Flagellar operon protein n=1 Tax=Anaeromicropila populeti TaxID=37658 RepID=A0A1I6KXD1_9FIRM|nr:TIGR02530 family flagellar biosynthesis protein [Anaeromicropila populeti]SFR95854.1 flagellar operon protein [Anaeromicropila populeti]